MSIAKYPVLVLGALALATGQALSERGRHAVSATRAFSIDGKRFLVGEAVDNRTLLQQELARRGIDAARLSDDLASLPDSRTVEPLREEPKVAPASSLPGALAPDHVLRLETAVGPVEIAFGRVAREDTDILRRLRSSGWDCSETNSAGTIGAIARLTKGKETSFVLLEKNEGRFLAIRRAVR